MDFLSKIRESPNYERLKTSLEAKAILKDSFISGSILFFAIILTIYASLTNRSQMSIAFLIITTISLFLFIYHVHSFVAIFSHPDDYRFVQVQLSQVWFDRGRVHCWARFTSAEGKEIKVKVGSILPEEGWNKETYLDRDALVAFNSTTGRAILISLLSN